MSPADVDVPRTSPTEIVKATDNYPRLHGWHTHLNPPVAHMSPSTQCVHQSRRSITSKCHEHMQAFLMVVNLGPSHRISGTTHARARSTHQTTPDNGSSHGLYGRIALSWVLPQPYRALPENTTEMVTQRRQPMAW